MFYVVYHIESAHVVLTTGSERVAKTIVTKRNKKARARLGNMNVAADAVKYAYTDKATYDRDIDVMVATTNILGVKGNVVMIKKSQLGGCCDPGTERYHCM